MGRATKGAAIAEKAIISNFMNKYKEAAKYAKELITLGIYDLHPNYAELFCLHMKIMSRLYLIDSIWKMQKINLLEVI